MRERGGEGKRERRGGRKREEGREKESEREREGVCVRERERGFKCWLMLAFVTVLCIGW